MRNWRDRRLIDLLGLESPFLLAPMAGSGGVALAIAAGRGGALASLPGALLDAATLRNQVAEVRAAGVATLNLNFFCHTMPESHDDGAWAAALRPFAEELGVTEGAPPVVRRPFDETMATLVEALRPAVVSFHFGLPAAALVARVKAAGALILASATTPAEGRWLVAGGADAVIAQGWEAGGHSGRFLPADGSSAMTTLALVPQLIDALDVPVIAAGGIADARGIAAAAMLGAAAVQLGTAFLACPESLIGSAHRERLGTDAAEETVMTNVFTGRPARGFPNRLTRALGPINPFAPPFPHAGDALAPLRARDPIAFGNMWAGQAAALARGEPAETLARRLSAEADALLGPMT